MLARKKDVLFLLDLINHTMPEYLVFPNGLQGVLFAGSLVFTKVDATKCSAPQLLGKPEVVK